MGWPSPSSPPGYPMSKGVWILVILILALIIWGALTYDPEPGVRNYNPP